MIIEKREKTNEPKCLKEIKIIEAYFNKKKELYFPIANIYMGIEKIIFNKKTNMFKVILHSGVEVSNIHFKFPIYEYID